MGLRCLLHGCKRESGGPLQLSAVITLLVVWAHTSSCEPTAFREKVTGAVGAGNYSYYTLSKPGAVTILVHPLAGDPDLYVAERNAQPTFDLDSHCAQEHCHGTNTACLHVGQELSCQTEWCLILWTVSYFSLPRLSDMLDLANESTTCGRERIDLPRSFGRPVGIGIYGHPSHELSLYELEVRVDDSTENLLFNDYGYAASHQPGSHEQDSSAVHGDDVADDIGPSEEISLLWTFLLGVLKLLLEILQG